MRAGEMDREITIEQDTGTTSDAVGEPIANWTEFAKPRAKVSPTAGREGFDAGQYQATADTEFRIYWLAGVSVKMRIVYDDARYNILDIRELGRREGLIIVAQRVAT